MWLPSHIHTVYWGIADSQVVVEEEGEVGGYRR
jgi:hypothetical protein